MVKNGGRVAVVNVTNKRKDTVYVGENKHLSLAA